MYSDDIDKKERLPEIRIASFYDGVQIIFMVLAAAPAPEIIKLSISTGLCGWFCNLPDSNALASMVSIKSLH
jgi:hypothetical protein